MAFSLFDHKNHIKTKDIHQLLLSSSSTCKEIQKLLQSYLTPTNIQNISEYLKSVKPSAKSFGGLYLLIRSQLSPLARRNEATKIFSVFSEAVTNLQKSFDYSVKQFTDIFTNDKVTPLNITITQLLLLQLVDSTHAINTFIASALPFLIEEASGLKLNYVWEAIKPETFKSSMAQIITILNLISKDPTKPVFKQIQQAALQEGNLHLVNPEGKPNPVVSALSVNGTLGKALAETSKIAKSKGFISPQEYIYTTYLYFVGTYYHYLELHVQWATQRKALLELKKQNVDPNSPEYRKLEQVIEKYETRIALMNKKINKWRNTET